MKRNIKTNGTLQDHDMYTYVSSIGYSVKNKTYEIE